MNSRVLPEIVCISLEWLQVVDINNNVRFATNSWGNAYDCWVNLIQEMGCELSLFVKKVLPDFFAVCSKDSSEQLFGSNNYHSAAKFAYEKSCVDFLGPGRHQGKVNKHYFRQERPVHVCDKSITSEATPFNSVVDKNEDKKQKFNDLAGSSEILKKLVGIAETKKYLTTAEMFQVPEVLEMPIDKFEKLCQDLLDVGVHCFASDEAGLQWVRAKTNKVNTLKKKTGKSFKKVYERVVEIAPDQSIIMKRFASFSRLPRGGVRHFMRNLLSGNSKYKQLAFQKLYLHYAGPTVRAAVRYYQKNKFSHLELGDLIQEGLEDLNNVLKDYAQTGSTKFQSSLMLRLFNTFTRAHLTDLPARIPAHQYEKTRSLTSDKQSCIMINTEFNEQTCYDLASKLGLMTDDFKDTLKILQGSQCLEKVIEGEGEAAVEQDFAYIHLQNSITAVLQNLSPRERIILRMRYGLVCENPRNGINHYSPHTLEDIGSRLGVTRERIRQIEQKALKKLRYPSKAKKLRVYWLER